MFSSASIEKGKKASLTSYDQEQTRTMGEGQEHWQNENIDAEMNRTHAISVVLNNHGGSVEAAVNARIEEAGVKRVRKDAVLFLKTFATMPDYSARSDLERRQFEESFKRFLERRYGEGNVVDMRWHFDESSPHLHATVVPITQDGRLCAKELFKPTKKNMEQWQREYYAEVAAPLHYSQPQFGRSAEKGYTAETKATREQLECLQGTKAQVEQEVAGIEAEIEQVHARNRAAVERNRELGSRADDLAREVEGLRDHVGRLEATVRAVSAALVRVSGVLDMAVHKVRGGFQKAREAFEAGLRALESDQEMELEMDETENIGLDELMNNYSNQEVFGYGDSRNRGGYDDRDL